MTLALDDAAAVRPCRGLADPPPPRTNRPHILSPAIERARASREPSRLEPVLEQLAQPSPRRKTSPSVSEPGEPVEFSDYSGMIAALIEWRNRRNISLEQLDELGGAPKGYFSKICGPNAVRRIGLQSLAWAFGGLGVKCIMVDDAAARAKIERRFEARDAAHLRSAVSGGRTARVANAIAPELKARGLSDQEIEALARRAVRAIPRSKRKRPVADISAPITAKLFGWPAP